MPSNKIVGVLEVALLCKKNMTHIDECMHSFNVNMHDANAIVKNLIPNISNKGQIPLIPKDYRRPILKIEHMTWTYDPKPDPKEP